MRTISGPVLPVLQLLVPLTAAASFFVFRGNAADLNNPNLPFAFRLFKDVAFLALVFGPLFFAIVARRLVVPVPYLVYWLFPLWLALLAVLIAGIKGVPGLLTPGQFRNLSFYYVGGGAIAALGWRFGHQELLFRSFRALMAGSVLLGVAFYVFAENLLAYTIHMRMIGTVGNPNFLGFLCFLWWVVVHGAVSSAERVRGRDLLELALITIGLVASGSMAALLSVAVWMGVVSVLGMLFPEYRSATLHRLLRLELVAGSVLIGVGTILFGVLAPAYLQIFRRVQGISESETISIRLQDYGRMFAELLTPEGLLLGQTSSGAYIQFDSSNASILFNFGLPFFVLWSIFFLAPVCIAFLARYRLAQGGVVGHIALMLVPAYLVSYFVEFSIQYVPEMYPTCVVIAWQLYFLVLAALRPGELLSGAATPVPPAVAAAAR